LAIDTDSSSLRFVLLAKEAPAKPFHIDRSRSRHLDATVSVGHIVPGQRFFAKPQFLSYTLQESLLTLVSVWEGGASLGRAGPAWTGTVFLREFSVQSIEKARAVTIPFRVYCDVEVELKTSPHSSRRRNRKGSAPVRPPARGKTIQDLARELGAKPFDPQAFAGIVPPGEDIGAFVEEIYRART
jgi:hypothetical protein